MARHQENLSNQFLSVLLSIGLVLYLCLFLNGMEACALDFGLYQILCDPLVDRTR